MMVLQVFMMEHIKKGIDVNLLLFDMTESLFDKLFVDDYTITFRDGEIELKISEDDYRKLFVLSEGNVENPITLNIVKY